MQSKRSLPDNQLLQDLRKKAYIPGMTVAVIADGKLSQIICSGVSNMEWGTPITADTAFPVASLSKPVFAYLVFQLIEHGVLKNDFLDQPLYEILPEYQPFFVDSNAKNIRFDHNAGKEVTPSLILSHRAGFPKNWIYPKDDKFQFPEKLTNEFVYSGEGYHYLQKAIEQITKKSLQELALEYVFNPLKMHNSSFSGPVKINKVATGHDEEMNPNLPSGEPRENAGVSLVSTITDFGFFMVNLLEQIEKNARFKEFMQAITPVIKNEPTAESLFWTLGWGSQESKGDVTIFHWGDVPNFKLFAAKKPKNRSAIVIFTNSQNGMEVIQEIINAFSPTVGNLQYSLDYLSQHYGYKHLKDTPGWQQRYEALVAEMQGQHPLALALFKEAQSLNPEDNMPKRHIEWLNNLLMIQENPVQISSKTLKKYRGRYGPLVISPSNGQLQLQVGGQTHTLFTLSNNIFLDNDDKVKLEFSVDKETPILKCHFLKNDEIVVFSINPTTDLAQQSMFSKSKKPSKSEIEEKEEVDITKEEMAKSAFGQGSNTAKNLKN